MIDEDPDLPFAPMLAVTGPLPVGEDQQHWAFEGKWDGMRLLTRLGPRRWRGWSRTGRDVTASYPDLGEGGGLTTLADRLGHHDLVLDGEVVATEESGRPSFTHLQQRMHVHRPSDALMAEVPVLYVVFDLLRLDAHDTVSLPYRDRRRLLEELDLPGQAAGADGTRGRLQVPAVGIGDGKTTLGAARALGLEGVVAKRLDSPYRVGGRSTAWRKIKLIRTQEVTVVGWAEGEGTRSGTIGALLVAVAEPDGSGGPRWRYAGKVGTGFTDAVLHDLVARLAPLERPDPVVSGPMRVPRTGTHWVDPVLVGEVAFTEWTRDGRLRHPTWRGLRPDKDPAETVLRED